MAEKRYYWIKLKDTFFTSDTVDFLMSQKEGANYVVLYQMLCMKTANTGGKLSRKIGEIIIPYDVEKIQRDCKYFSIDTVRIALTLYKQLGLIYEQANGVLQIANFENIVGSESTSAERVRQMRARQALQCNKNVTKNVTTDIDNRYKSINSNNILIPPKSPLTEKENNNNKPTKSEVVTYFTETLHRSEEEGQRFWAWNENRGWQVGNSPIRKWQLFADAWKNENVQSKGQLERQYGETDICNYFSDLHDFDNIEV